MSKIIFCNIAWMKDYRGVTEDYKPVNGGKFVNENGTAYECYNFFPVNHFCYGFFQAHGQQLNLERIDKNVGNSEVVHDVTVVWVANRKIVGWYDNAEVFKYWQGFNDPTIDAEHGWWDHLCKAREEKVFLIPVEKRNFAVPSAAKNGTGKGMGQSNIWYADSAWAKENFLPEVEKYLESLRGKYPIEYLKAEEINKKIPRTNKSEEKLIEEAIKLFQDEYFLDALDIFNYLIYNAEKPYNVVYAKFGRGFALDKLLFYDEAIETYKRVLWEFNQLDDADKKDNLDFECAGNLGRLYTVLQKYTLAYSLWEQLFENETEIEFKADALRRMMWICEAEEDWNKLQELLKIYDGLETEEFLDDVKELKKFLRKIKRNQKNK